MWPQQHAAGPGRLLLLQCAGGMDVHTDPLRQAASRSSLGAVALAALVSATVGDGGYLGISSDIHGLYRTPPRALHSLRSDFHFARDHSLSAGDPPLELSAISDFGGSMHLQLDVSLHPAGSATPRRTS